MISTYLAYLDLDICPGNSLYILRKTCDDSNGSLCNDLEALGTMFKSNLYERLYNDAEELRFRKETNATNYQKKLKSKNDKEITGKPRILDLSKRIVEANRKIGFIDAAYQWANNRDAKINAQRHEQLLKESQLLTAPKINNYTQHSNTSRQSKPKEQEEINSHHPQITKLAKNLKRTEKVEDRLISEGKKMQTHVDALRIQDKCQSYKFISLSAANQVFEKLYKNGMEVKEKLKSKALKQESTFIPHINEKTTEPINRKPLYYIPDKSKQENPSASKIPKKDCNLEDFLSRNYTQQRNKTLGDIVQLQPQEEGCSFKPNINHNHLAGDGNVVVYDKLFKLAEERRLLNEAKQKEAEDEREKADIKKCRDTPQLYTRIQTESKPIKKVVSPKTYSYSNVKKTLYNDKKPTNKKTDEQAQIEQLATQLKKKAQAKSRSIHLFTVGDHSIEVRTSSENEDINSDLSLTME